MNRMSLTCLNFGMTLSFALLFTCQAVASGQASPNDNCHVLIEVTHQTSDCSLQQIDTKQPTVPRMESTCGKITSVHYTDTHWELGCSGSNGLTGYFAANRWINFSDDDGVDVTGAPNNLLVEGANSATVTVPAGQTKSLGFVVPADGFIRFDWSKIGGSNFIFSIAINNHTCPYIVGENGSFFSDPLQPGDVLTLDLEASAFDEAKIQLSSFSFLTSATGLTVRKWVVGDEKGNQAIAQQFIALTRPSLSDIIFPENFDGIEAPIRYGDASCTPEKTGVPVFDLDGTSLTTSDQLPVDQINCQYAMSHKDHHEWEENICTIRRKWTIEDQCKGTTYEATQIIKHIGPPCVKESIPASYDMPMSRFSVTARIQPNINSIPEGKENVNTVSYLEPMSRGIIPESTFIVE